MNGKFMVNKNYVLYLYLTLRKLAIKKTVQLFYNSMIKMTGFILLKQRSQNMKKYLYIFKPHKEVGKLYEL